MAILDRIPSPASESDRYPIRELLPRAVVVREVDWALTGDFPLDQGEEGACVGFGTSAELSAEPVALPTGAPFAFRLYQLARAEDAAMGHRFPAGASVLAGLKAARKLGLIQGYRWARSPLDVRDAVLAHGSVVVGSEWLDGMDSWDAHGFVSISGASRGGHCWTIIGYTPRHAATGRPAYKAINSWGERFGVRGRFWVDAQQFDDALWPMGTEAAIVTDTPQTPTPPPAPPKPAARRWLRIPAWFRQFLCSRGVAE